MVVLARLRRFRARFSFRTFSFADWLDGDPLIDASDCGDESFEGVARDATCSSDTASCALEPASESFRVFKRARVRRFRRRGRSDIRSLP